MSKLYRHYRTDPEKDTKGVWIEFPAAGVRLRIARAGITNKRYQAALEKALKPYRRALGKGLMDDDTAKKIVMKVFADTIVMDWEGLEDEDGQPVEFSAEACFKVFSDLPEFFGDVQGEAQDLAAFREDFEEDSKNL